MGMQSNKSNYIIVILRDTGLTEVAKCDMARHHLRCDRLSWKNERGSGHEMAHCLL